MQGQTRNRTPDYLKAISIIGVVWIHAGAIGAELFRFCVPVFVSIWVIHFERALSKQGAFAAKRRYGQLVISKLVQIMGPFVAWTIFYVLFRYNFNELASIPIRTYFFGLIGGYGFPGQYFLLVLMQLCIVVPFVSKLVNRKNYARLTALSFLLNFIILYLFSSVSAIEKLSYRPFFYWIPFVLIGVAIERGYMSWRPELLLFLVPALACTSLELGWFSELGDYTSVSVSLAALALLSLLSTDGRGEWRASSIMSGPLDRAGRYIGRNTFPIFLLNPLFVDTVGPFFTSDAARILLVPIVIALCLISGRGLEFAGFQGLIGLKNR